MFADIDPPHTHNSNPSFQYVVHFFFDAHVIIILKEEVLFVGMLSSFTVIVNPCFCKTGGSKQFITPILQQSIFYKRSQNKRTVVDDDRHVTFDETIEELQ